MFGFSHQIRKHHFTQGIALGLCLSLGWLSTPARAQSFEDGNAARQIFETVVRTAPGWTPVVIEGGKMVVKGAAICLGATVSAILVGASVLFIPTNHYSDICPVHAPRSGHIPSPQDLCTLLNGACYHVTENGTLHPWTGTQHPSTWRSCELDVGLAGNLNDPDFAVRLRQWLEVRNRRLHREMKDGTILASNTGGEKDAPGNAGEGRSRKKEKPIPKLTPEEIAEALSVKPEKIEQVLVDGLLDELQEEFWSWRNGDLFRVDDERHRIGAIEELYRLLTQGRWLVAMEFIQSMADIDLDQDNDERPVYDADLDVGGDEDDFVDRSPSDFEISPEDAAEMVLHMLPEWVAESLHTLLESMSVVTQFRFFPDHMRREVFQRVLESWSYSRFRSDGYTDFWDNLISGSGVNGETLRTILKRVPELSRALHAVGHKPDMLGHLLAIEFTLEFIEYWDRYTSSVNQNRVETSDVSALTIVVIRRLFDEEGGQMIDRLMETEKSGSPFVEFTSEFAEVLRLHIDQIVAGEANGNGRMSKDLAFEREKIIHEFAKLSGLSTSKAEQVYDAVLQEVMHIDRDPLGFHHEFPTREEAFRRAKKSR